MNYKDAECRGAYAAALKAAQNLAVLANFQGVSDPAIMPPELKEGLVDPDGNLVLLPRSDDHLPNFDRALRDIRSTVLVIQPGFVRRCYLSFHFTLIRCATGKIEHHHCLRLWVDLDRKLYLVPDPDGDDPQSQCFAIGRSIRPVARPWTNPWEHSAGVSHAEVLLLAP